LPSLAPAGLELAKVAKLPSRVLDVARIASLTLENLAEDGRRRSKEGKLARRRRCLLEVRSLFSLKHRLCAGDHR